MLEIVLHALSLARHLFGMPFSTLSQADTLEILASDLGLEVRGSELFGAIDQIHVTIQIRNREVGAFSAYADPTGQNQAHPFADIRLLDPKGPAGMDVIPQSTLNQLTSGPDLELGDPAFDDAILLAAADPVTAIGLLDPATRRRLVQLVNRGWMRMNAEWIRVDASATLLALREELEQGIEACKLLRATEALGIRLEARLGDPSPRVRHLASLHLLERDWLDADQLQAMMSGDDANMAVMAAERLGDEGTAWLWEALRHRDKERRVLAAVALAKQSPDRAADLEPVLLGGVSSPHAAACLEQLAELGGAMTLSTLRERPEAQAALQRIHARRATRMGELSLASLQGGELSVPEAPDDEGAA